MVKFEVTPWEIKGDIDYAKVIKDVKLDNIDMVEPLYIKKPNVTKKKK